MFNCHRKPFNVGIYKQTVIQYDNIETVSEPLFMGCWAHVDYNIHNMLIL